MTQSLRGASAGTVGEESRALHQQFATEIAVERTRMLYQGSQVPTLFMLLGGLTCAALLWQPQPSLLLAGWLVWLVLLAVLRLIQMTAFKNALPSRQANPHWHRVFLVGAGLSGLTLAFAAIVLVPAERFLLQAMVYGLIAAAILSASIAYAVSRSAFLVFALPCLLPTAIYLLLSEHPGQQGWGALGLLMLLSLCVVAWQVNRLIQRSLLRRFENQALIERLQHARESAEGLNQELAREVEQRRRAERELRQAHGELEIRVAQRTLELDDTSHALGKSEERLALALDASELGLWDWNLETDEVHHSHLEHIFGIRQEEVKGVLTHSNRACIRTICRCYGGPWLSISRDAPTATVWNTACAMPTGAGAGSRTEGGQWSATSRGRCCACSVPVEISPSASAWTRNSAWLPPSSRLRARVL